MSHEETTARVSHERVGRVLKITIDNVSRRNSFVPEMMRQLSDALTLLDTDPDLWAGVLCAAGDHFTAGLDMPKFFGPGATPADIPADNVDAFQLTRFCRKPVITAVQGVA